jgi:hypothetical protein
MASLGGRIDPCPSCASTPTGNAGWGERGVERVRVKINAQPYNTKVELALAWENASLPAGGTR